MKTKLALHGGQPIRKKPMASRPKLSELEGKFIEECLSEKNFSRFIGSPISGYKKQLRLTSQEADGIQDMWSVLGGKYVRKFEAAFAEEHNVPYAICVNSATSALITVLKAVGINHGDEVITTPFTFTATAASILLVGAVPVFADIDPETFCLSRATIEKVISNKTKAVIPVHILGNAGDFSGIVDLCNERKLTLIEDSCQAIRTKYNGKYLGSIGKAGVFSFQESKNMMTGEGGMIITSCEETAYRCRMARNHGEALVDKSDSDNAVYSATGFNFRLPELLAALGLAQVTELKNLNEIRSANYKRLIEGLDQFRDFIQPQKITHLESFYPYTAGFRLISDKLEIGRNLFAHALRAEGIPVSSGFPRVLNENEIFQRPEVLRKQLHLSENYPIHSYSSEDTPVAKTLNSLEYLGFFQIGYPQKEEDMDDIAMGIEKVIAYQEQLYEKFGDMVETEYTTGRN